MSTDLEWAQAKEHWSLTAVEPLAACQSHLPARHRASWTEAPLGRMQSDEELLTFWWHDVTLETIAKRLDRTPKAVYERAGRLGLFTCEAIKTVTAVAAEMGVDRKTLRRILAAAEVPTKRSKRDPFQKKTRRKRRQKKKHSRRFVDRDEARAAVAVWSVGETMTAAAARLGHLPGWLKLRLVAAGVYVASLRHHYSEAIITAAIEAYEPRRVIVVAGVSRTVPEWAAELGLTASAIHRRLGLGWSEERAVTEPKKVKP